jgi:hypothetical protein
MKSSKQQGAKAKAKTILKSRCITKVPNKSGKQTKRRSKATK